MHHRIASFDGQAIHLSKLATALRGLGCEVLIVGPPVVGRLATGRVLPMVDALRRRLPRSIYEGLEFCYSGVAIVRLLWAWLRFRPDVLYERFNLYQPAGLWLKRLVGIPMLLEVNAPLCAEREAERPIVCRRLAAWSERAVLQGADRVLPVSRALARLLERSGVSAHRIVVVPNGADQPFPERFPTSQEAKIRLGVPGRTVIGFVGFVRAWHRLDWAAELISHEGASRNLHLLIIGDVADGSDTEWLAQESLNGRVTITGAVAPEHIAAYLAAVDIAIQPGATDYASPIKIFEYMAQALAIVAPDKENIREILDDTCALLYEPEDSGAFLKAVLRLCERPDERRSLAKAAGQRFQDKRLTWAHSAERVQAIALETIAETANSSIAKSTVSRPQRTR